MKLICVIFLGSILMATNGHARDLHELWLGTWRIQKLICPKDCSGETKRIYRRSRRRNFVFHKYEIVDPSTGVSDGSQCPAKPDYLGLKQIKLGEFLSRYMMDKSLNAPLRLSQKLKIKLEEVVTAGVIRCDMKNSPWAIAAIFVNSKTAYLLMDQDVVWQLDNAAQ